MIDHMFSRDIDIQGLNKVLEATIDRPRSHFNMGMWRAIVVRRLIHAEGDERSFCGTTCCMIGSFCEANEDDELVLDRDGTPELRGDPYHLSPISSIACRFGLTEDEANWLFDVKPSYLVYSATTPPQAMIKQQAINRLRTFINYKIRRIQASADQRDFEKETKDGRLGQPGTSAVLGV